MVLTMQIRRRCVNRKVIYVHLVSFTFVRFVELDWRRHYCRELKDKSISPQTLSNLDTEITSRYFPRPVNTPSTKR